MNTENKTKTDNIFRVMMIGDVVGTPGLLAIKDKLKNLIAEYSADLVVANGENAANGFGLTQECADLLFESGVDVITSGNHIWEKKDSTLMLESNERILRPLNYPNENPGHGFIKLEQNNRTCVVINLQGREAMTAIDSPFSVGKAIIEQECPKNEAEKSSVVIIDFHAESFSEKEALALYLDGQASVFAGTHTHVQTADERILPGGTGYIGDLGMSGPVDSIIGVNPDACLKRNISQMPIKMETSENPAFICGAIFDIDDDGHCVSVNRIFVKETKEA